MSGARHGLRRRLVAAFGLFAMLGALCFGALGIVFMYTVEDSLFANMLQQEEARQRQAWRSGGRLATPLQGFVSVHRGVAGLPPDLARALASGARGSEVAGDAGRHYHLRRVDLDGPVVLVAEVSRELVVRPRLPSLLALLGAAMLTMLGLTVGVGYLIARRATAPLSELSALLAQAAPERLPRGFAARFGDDEIGALARALDAAMARIAGFIEREQHFTRDASHELRTPLAVIDGAAQLLAQQPMAPQAAAQLQRIRGACADMTQTVQTLLSLAREELGTPAPEQVNLLALVETVVLQCAHLLDDKAVEVVVEVDARDCLLVHRQALAILLSNLVANAFAHTSAGTVRIHRDGGWLVVDDGGPGMAPGIDPYQAGAKGAHSTGYGLGLSIAKRLGERHGIGLAIDSHAGGTRARLALPRASAG